MSNQRNISVIGLGYVGLTVAVAFSKLKKVIGFDKNLTRIEELKNGYDRNDEISKEQLQLAKINYSINENDLKKADFHIITVPTPVDKNNCPDFSLLFEASKTVGKQLKKGDIVVYESTVYPGATEDKCIPILETISQLVCGVDFSVGYSPERINPADKVHTFENIVKIVSATDEATLEIIANVYASVIKAGVHCVSCICVAEATKVIENTQRDLNISILNEITIILHNFGINMSEVLAAAETKWNFLPFRPGLVGGHCMSTNSYYLAHKAQEMGYHPDIILAGRRTNEYMATFIVEQTIKNLHRLCVPINKSKIGILGLSYKENYAGFQDTKVIDIINELKSHDAKVLVHDPISDFHLVQKEYGIALASWEDFVDMDAIILTVAHQHYVDLDQIKFINELSPCKLIMDVKGILDPNQFLGTDIIYWRL